MEMGADMKTGLPPILNNQRYFDPNVDSSITNSQVRPDWLLKPLVTEARTKFKKFSELFDFVKVCLILKRMFIISMAINFCRFYALTGVIMHIWNQNVINPGQGYDYHSF